MNRKSIEVDYRLNLDEIKDAIDYHLSLKEIHNKDTESLEFETDEDGNVSGARLKIWL